MRLFDTHLHLDAPVFDSDWQAVWEHAGNAGVVYGANASAFPPTWELTLNYAKRIPNFLPCIGIHPMVADRGTPEILTQMKSLLSSHKIYAISEIGLDPLFPEIPMNIQEKVFRHQLDLSLEFQLPICLHIRKKHEDVLKILDEYNQNPWKGIAHCFSGSLEQAHEFIKRGFLISFAGPVTNPNAKKLHRIAVNIPIEKMVIETDSPDLPPRYLNQSRNEPAFLVEVAKALSNLRKMSLTDITGQIFQTSCHLFGVPL